MIHYKQDFWISLRILLHANGSVVPYALPRAIMAGFLCFVYMHWGIIDTSVRGGSLMWHPTCFIIFLQISTYTLAFHTNQAYNRYWEARTQVQQMASYWGDVASQVVAFDEASSSGGTTADGSLWRAHIIHLISLLHAVCIQYLLHQDAPGTHLEVLGGVDKDESEILGYSNDQAFLVMHWISQQISVRQMSGGLAVPAPILSRSWQVLSLGMLAFNQACKIEDTPFPFPYVQLLHIMDLLMTVISPFVIASWMSHEIFAVVLTMMGVGAFHAMFSAACIMETPFGRRSNDLPLIELHQDFIGRLKSVVDSGVAEQLNSMILSRSKEEKESCPPTAPMHNKTSEQILPDGRDISVNLISKFTHTRRFPSQLKTARSAAGSGFNAKNLGFKFCSFKTSAKTEDDQESIFKKRGSAADLAAMQGANNRRLAGDPEDTPMEEIHAVPHYKSDFPLPHQWVGSTGDSQLDLESRGFAPARTDPTWMFQVPEEQPKLPVVEVPHDISQKDVDIKVVEPGSVRVVDSQKRTPDIPFRGVGTGVSNGSRANSMMGFNQIPPPSENNLPLKSPKLLSPTGTQQLVRADVGDLAKEDIHKVESDLSDASEVFLEYKRAPCEGHPIPRQRRTWYAHSEVVSLNALDNQDARSEISWVSDSPSRMLRHQDSFPHSDTGFFERSGTRKSLPIRHVRSQEYLGSGLLRYPHVRRDLSSGREVEDQGTLISCDQELPISTNRRIGSDGRSPISFLRLLSGRNRNPKQDSLGL